jgi:flagellar hook-associated protein 3 FlgL
MSQEISRQSQIASQIAVKQTQISSGKRLQRSSDDPHASSRIAELARIQTNDSARARNISLAISLTAQADGQLGGASELLARAQVLVLAAAGSNAGQSGRVSAATELLTLADDIEAMSLVNSATGEKLFADNIANAFRFDDEIVFAPVPTRQDVFRSQGRYIFDIIREAACSVDAGDTVSVGLSLTAIGVSIGDIADDRALIGANAARLERLQDYSGQRGIEVSVERSSLEDTDLSSAIIELNVLTVTLEAAQAAFSRINRRTLLDFLL